MSLMNKEFVMIDDFDAGFRDKTDRSKIPLGASRAGQNVAISNGERISVSKGRELFKDLSIASTPIHSAYNFRKAIGREIPLAAADDTLYYYHEGTEAYETLKDGYTSGAKFGFQTFNENIQFSDYVYFCNAKENYSSWRGNYTQLDGALTGGEVTITVDTVIDEDVFYFSAIAFSATTTTIDVASTSWATDQWVDLYVHILDGPQAGSISQITTNTATQITFGAIAGLSGTPAFEIVQLLFEDTGSIVVDGTEVAYTAIPTSTTFTVASAPAAADDAAVTQAVTEHIGNPKGNILQEFLGKMLVAGVEEAPHTIYVSAQNDPTDFSFSSPRVAGEGDLGTFAEGDGAITGIGKRNETAYVFKNSVIYTFTYTQDGNDLATTDLIIDSPNVGTVSSGSVESVDNDIFYGASVGGIKKVGDIPNLNQSARTTQVADRIRNTMNRAVFDESASVFFDDRFFMSAKLNVTSNANDVIFVYNVARDSWELPILSNVNEFFIYNDELYSVDSLESKVWKFYTGFNIKVGESFLSSRSEWVSGDLNMAPAGTRAEFDALFIEGFMTENTVLTVTLDYEYNGIAGSRTTTIDPVNNPELFLVSASSAPLGVPPLGTGPLGSGSGDDDADLQKFRVYLTTTKTPFYELSISFSSEGESQHWEILRFGFNAQVHSQVDINLKKKLS